jgi:hypothetical protein
MPHRPSHNPAKNISSPFIGRKYAIADQKGRGSAVVGNHPHGDVGLEIPPVGNAADVLDLSKDGFKEVRLIVTSDTLKDGRDPFQTHPCIDTRFGQGLKFSIRISIELHEDEVPEF